MGTNTVWFTFEAPVATHAHLNVPHTGGASLTVTGFNFGAFDYTASIQVCLLRCCACLPACTSTRRPAGRSASLPAYLPVRMHALTPTHAHSRMHAHSYARMQAHAHTCSCMLTCTPVSLRTQVGGLRCYTTAWTSDTSMICHAPQLMSMEPSSIFVSMVSVIGTIQDSFSYDSPSLSLVHLNSPPTGGAVMCNSPS